MQLIQMVLLKCREFLMSQSSGEGTKAPQHDGCGSSQDSEEWVLASLGSGL